MKQLMRKSLIFTLFIALSQGAFAAEKSSPATYKIDPVHSEVGFKVRHMMVSWVKGSFDDYKGTVTYDPKNPKSLKVKVEIKSASINTKNDKRDKHLRSEEFFDVIKYPKITFESTRFVPKGRFTKNGAGRGVLYGRLYMHGVVKDVKLDVEIAGTISGPWGNVLLGASAEPQKPLKRDDYNITWNEVLDVGGVMVGNEIHIALEVEAQKMKAPEQTAENK